jgi:hypothetical protein
MGGAQHLGEETSALDDLRLHWLATHAVDTDAMRTVAVEIASMCSNGGDIESAFV